MHSLRIKYSKQDKKRQSEHWAGFKLARIELKAHKRGKVEAKEKKSKAAALLFSGGSGMKTD